MEFDNITDAALLKGGTLSFTLDDVAVIADIESIEYVPLGPGVFNVTVTLVRRVADQVPIGDRLELGISCLFAEVDRKPRELIIHQLVPTAPYGELFSFRAKD